MLLTPLFVVLSLDPNASGFGTMLGGESGFEMGLLQGDLAGFGRLHKQRTVNGGVGIALSIMSCPRD